MSEKSQELADDMIQNNVLSDCCDAIIYGEDICSKCREHCEPSVEETEEEKEYREIELEKTMKRAGVDKDDIAWNSEKDIDDNYDYGRVRNENF